MNECMNNNGGCDQICTDTEDSFNCSCNTGYTLDSDGSNCSGETDTVMAAAYC